MGTFRWVHIYKCYQLIMYLFIDFNIMAYQLIKLYVVPMYVKKLKTVSHEPSMYLFVLQHFIKLNK